ncbi:hypothetical protein QYM36_010303 [Artemia franciscana]|uniref:Uncharacterized protein n=1 Tax=Artemia franciscana TaxID=6661 RepID=A0AA88I5I9_ARTSF|nr:hypothetical protein QYM36_010303 [Artemia franciscana]
MLWKNVVKTELECSFSASDIPESEWSAQFINKFGPPDPKIEAKAKHGLTEFLNAHPASDFLVTQESS